MNYVEGFDLTICRQKEIPAALQQEFDVLVDYQTNSELKALKLAVLKLNGQNQLGALHSGFDVKSTICAFRDLTCGYDADSAQEKFAKNATSRIIQ